MTKPKSYYNKSYADINTPDGLYCLDAEFALPYIHPNSIDLICIDPPYNLKQAKWDKPVNWYSLNLAFYRILKPTGNLIIFQGWSHALEAIRGMNSFLLNDWIIWDRQKGRGAKRRLVSTREDILWFVKSEDHYTFNKIDSDIPKKTKGMGQKNGRPNRALSNVWTDISPIVPWSKEKVDHPTQKPLKLIERIIKVFSNENEIVLDCFAGSYTVAEASKNLNRRFICFDNKRRYYNIGRKRLKR